MKENYEQKVRGQFPNLQYGEFKVLDNCEERLAIDDLSYKRPSFRSQIEEAIELLILSCKGFVNVCKAEDLAISMNNKLEDLLNKLDPERTLLIFSGKGSQPVKDLLPKEIFSYFPSINLEMCRRLSPDMRVEGVDVLTKRNVVRKIIPSKLLVCVLIDDVIASGSTAQATKLFIDDRTQYEWYAVNWMTLSPLQSKTRKQEDIYKSSLPGFLQVVSPIVYQGISGIPANNSLSSFAEVGEKSETVISGYKRKYVEDNDMFDQAIRELRRLNNE